ncbi:MULTISPECIES: nucleoside-diphosphate sugar epimerase/dehydratase [unclassified Halomonas]|uniref:nucleoside-diphosphate sugar epimerase/dehydratase n=1 Tax=unclassified Halomonas TaxID=2609666 RepID=UPI001EF5C058|nr:MULTISPECIES: hypothetical protein [unclassified Halomonas]MCP1340913.1 hypothetical protein [Halomonas sp. FL8]MCP1361636.1 hypothetical protein [Halomonas sp. BBD45]MCP1367461.1 hypothetical protein [Halomonas sp. BBD48]
MTPWQRTTAQRNDRARQPVILCGLDYEHYRIQSLIKRSRRYELLALIDDFPWNHGTLVDGVRVYYPSEAVSLARRHGVTRLLFHTQDDLAVFDGDMLSALKELGVEFTSMDSRQIDDIDAFLARQS